ncbi:hypothetical protein [Streptomyces sp. AK02-04a]|uniref:hypothetical protein n=1 Tax=Streptomyces sp. AK02-04a TaxID=3028649 RepID=UPI0029A85D0D|nr:hypothetical protein [Streptomyces sp. AK02-04a]MDX3763556.1 hypothetical protein [Streptomyces sp. AK02-04a]
MLATLVDRDDILGEELLQFLDRPPGDRVDTPTAVHHVVALVAGDVLGELASDRLESGLDLRLVSRPVLTGVLDGDPIATAHVLHRLRGERLAVVNHDLLGKHDRAGPSGRESLVLREQGFAW